MGLPLFLVCGAILVVSALFHQNQKRKQNDKSKSRLLPPGTFVDNRHQILECVGEGGLGVVYGAQDTRLHRAVAIKFVREEHRKEAQVEEQFFKEAIHASQINHPNIVTIYDFGRHNNQPFIVMEFLNGYTLDEFKLRPADDWQTFSVIALQILDGLDIAHENRLFHGDIKPTNIMVVPSKTKTPPTIKIFDFGLSRILKVDLKQVIDHDETVIGSIHYMAPEQFKGDHVDGRTDLYSAGVIFYEMLSGSLPFEADNGHALIEKIVFNDPIPLRMRNPKIPAYLDAAVMKLIDKNPLRRFQTAADAKATFRPIAHSW